MGDFLNGKKTYIVIGLFAVAFVIGLLLPEGQVIPEYIWGILGALGLGAIRAAIQDISGNAGYKTYVAAGVVFAVSVASAFSVALPLEVIYSICAALGVVGVRDAIGEIEQE